MKKNWNGDNMSSWCLEQIPISAARKKELKENPHRYLASLEYTLSVKAPMCDRITISMTESELVDLITNAELILKKRSLPQ